jgi:putative (di)nucleoside polyphosphate hydrolase
MDHSKLGYRLNVGIMVLNLDNLVWIGRRNAAPADAEGPGSWWQMPQGGIDEGEDPATAAVRELREETGIRSVQSLAESPNWMTYDLPPSLMGISWGGRYRGQKQKWFAMRFTGPDSEINITPPDGHEAEFAAWRWADAKELLGLIVPFKRDVYQRVLADFESLTRRDGR